MIDEPVEYRRLIFHIPTEQPDKNWNGWDLESSLLQEHLHELIKGYGIKILKQELKECELFLKKKK